MAGSLEHVDVLGVDCHIGSQITDTGPFEDALKSLKDFVNRLKVMGILNS